LPKVNFWIPGYGIISSESFSGLFQMTIRTNNHPIPDITISFCSELFASYIYCKGCETIRHVRLGRQLPLDNFAFLCMLDVHDRDRKLIIVWGLQ